MIAETSLSLERRHAIHHREEVMGTVVTIDVHFDSAVAKSEVYPRIARARAILQRADALFSTWKPDSPISCIRRGELRQEEAPLPVGAVLLACEEARQVSNGWFDPWAMPGGLDPSGYVKGWAAQRALEALVRPGVSGAIVNAAGDIATFGHPEGGGRFRIGIVDPQAPRKLACVVEIDGAIATSGTHERGPHLIDPHSGEARCRVGSASVTGPDLGLADALATALAVIGEDGLSVVDRLDGYEGLVIARDGSWISTTKFPFAPGADRTERTRVQRSEPLEATTEVPLGEEQNEAFRESLRSSVTW
jgi:thiamine biosynthesis lipoprotein